MKQSRSSHWGVALAALGLAVSVGACSTAGTMATASPKAIAAASMAAPTASPTPVPTPTASPSPTPTPYVDLSKICGGTPYPTADAYTGLLHPVYIFDASNKQLQYRTGEAGPAGNWQLAVCVGPSVLARTGYCGLYSDSNGTIGAIYRTKQTRTATVWVAQTGKKLSSKVLSGKSASCHDTMYTTLGKPPWYASGGPVTDAQIQAYADAVSRWKA